MSPKQNPPTPHPTRDPLLYHNCLPYTYYRGWYLAPIFHMRSLPTYHPGVQQGARGRAPLQSVFLAVLHSSFQRCFCFHKKGPKFHFIRFKGNIVGSPSYSRGGKSVGRHRHGSPPLPLHPLAPSHLLVLARKHCCFVLELLVERGDPSPPLHPAGDEAVQQLLLGWDPPLIIYQPGWALDIFHCLHFIQVS